MEINRKTIAVVDDSELARDMIETALVSLPGMDVRLFADGQKAWKALQGKDSVDMVITDVNMPHMDGLELLNKIKEKDPEKPCIVMSARPHYKKTAGDLRADGFLAKPFALSELFKMVEQLA